MVYLYIFYYWFFSVIGLILAQNDMVRNVRNVHTFANNDAAVFSVVAALKLWIIFNIEVRSISRSISSVWCALLIEYWVDVELNKVVICNRLMGLSVVQHNIIGELLKSIWQCVLHSNSWSSGHLKAIYWYEPIWWVVLFVPWFSSWASDAVSVVISSRFLELNNIENRQMIFIYIKWLYLRSSTVGL